MTYAPRLPPRAHQLEYVRRANGRPAFAALMDMGTGKTKGLLDEWGAMEEAGECRDLLVVAPAGCYRNWDRDSPGQPGELTKHLSEDLRGRCLVAAFTAGASAGQRRALAHVVAPPQDTLQARLPRVLLVNVEALSTVRAARDACLQFLAARPGAMMAVDESTTIANSESERTRWVHHIGEGAPVRRIMTGLPSPDSPLQLYGQFAFLNWRILGHRTWWGFKARHAVQREIEVAGPRGPRRTKIIVGYRDVEELQERIAPHSYRVRKEDCLDLPPKTYLRRDVELTPEQRRVYREVLENATAELADGTFVTAANKAVISMRLQQVVCGHAGNELGAVVPVRSNRVRELLGLLAEHDRKAVIWCGFDYSVRDVSEALVREYGPRAVSRFWGGNAGTQRLEEEAAFKRDRERRFMVATQAAGGRGNTWTAADLEVFYSNTPSADHRIQAEDRLHRDGQAMPVTIVDLVARGVPCDEALLRAARAKISLADVVAGDEPRAWAI